MTDSPEVYDHLSPEEESSVQDGVYRVVGTGESVTLLRVADAAGRRVHTGEVVTVPREAVAERFRSADNPDSGLSLGSVVPPLGDYAAAIRYWLPF